MVFLILKQLQLILFNRHRNLDSFDTHVEVNKLNHRHKMGYDHTNLVITNISHLLIHSLQVNRKFLAVKHHLLNPILHDLHQNCCYCSFFCLFSFTIHVHMHWQMLFIVEEVDHQDTVLLGRLVLDARQDISVCLVKELGSHLGIFARPAEEWETHPGIFAKELDVHRDIFLLRYYHSSSTYLLHLETICAWRQIYEHTI